MVLSDYIWQDFIDNRRSTVSYIVFYRGGPIDNWAHVTGTFSQYSAESEYNIVWTAVISLAHFRILNIELTKKDPDVVP